MVFRARRWFVVVLSATLAACASGGGATANKQRVPVRESSQLTAKELEGTQHQNAFDLIQSTRPRWLQKRGPQSITDRNAGSVVVYLDGTRIGGAATLRRIMAGDMEAAEYLTASEAMSRYGMNHSGGAILITTRRPR
jgi:hypothetical protein